MKLQIGHVRNITIYLILTHFLFYCALLFCSCFEIGKENNAAISPPFEAEEKKYYHYNFDCAAEEGELLSSQLIDKLSRLKDLKQRYEIVKSGRIKVESSIVFRAIKKKPELCLPKRDCFKIKNLDDLANAVYAANYARIKGSDEVENNWYAKADVEELVFKDEACAKALLSYVNRVRDIEYFWDSLDKSPSSMFREKNRVYFIRMRFKNLYSHNLRIREKMRG